MMTLKFKSFILLCFLLNLSFSQDKDGILLTVDGDPVMGSEFLSVYNKNLDLVKDKNQKNIDGYLDLFIEYQLKLKEAKRLKLDEDSKYKREFARYKKQLVKNYINESKVTDALVKEAYERTKTDVNASHVLIRLDDTSKDTLAIYNQLLDIRKKVENEGFDKVKQELHDGKTIFVEDLNYFSVFRMVYDFESVAYNTPVGEVSMPFRTQFGYHILKVKDKRTSKGTMHAAHIMVALQQKDALVNPEQRINEIYKKLNQGESFEALAKQFSDDKSSAKDGGKIRPFKSSQLGSVVFENRAFALTSNGDISQPFKTKFGWHIIKRIRLDPVPSFEKMKPSLESSIKKDSRSRLINKAMVKTLKARYTIKENPAFKPYFESIIDDTYFKNIWEIPNDLDENATAFSINEMTYSYSDFAKYLKSQERSYTKNNIKKTDIIDKEFESFFETVILQYRKDNLENENPEFAAIIKEYRDGLLLFDLLEKEVWNKAAKDSIGLENFYTKNKANYNWKQRVDMLMASSTDKSILEEIAQQMNTNTSQEEMNNAFNTTDKQNVIFTKGTYETDDSSLPENLIIKTGVSEIYEHNDTYHIININKILPITTKTLEEAKGSVINDYQQQIETTWVNELKARYNIKVNKRVLKSIKRKVKK